MRAAGFLLPATGLVALFFLVPVIATLVLSFTDLSTATFGKPSWIGFDNYRTVLGGRFTPMILLNTVRYVGGTLVFNIGMGLLLAIATSWIPARIGDHVRALWLLPRISSPVVYVLLWLSLMSEPAPRTRTSTGASRWATS